MSNKLDQTKEKIDESNKKIKENWMLSKFLKYET